MLIAGPTASGKSAAAASLAVHAMDRGRAAAVINADSMQVYGGLRVLTARPDVEAEADVPHRLYGHVPPSERYSVGRWLGDIAPVLAEARAQGALAIVVGGTGLYFRALTEGLTAVPEIAQEIRRRWLEALEQSGPEELHALLSERDPATASRLKPGDSTRIVRALEVLDATGRSLLDWQEQETSAPLLPAGSARRLVLSPERPVLYGRIDRRFEGMVAAGALDEVRDLLKLELSPELPAMKAIGVREFAAVLAGEMEPADAIARAQQETRRYAKRQGTWFRNQMSDWERIDA
ncbi:tRNA dimethylallyltransferase [Faunimonas pinastri]|uniref:tRNA dimethylallyltransferase n=1 Tax=Faunimonas pinastri TaxID=1855383 RepID=A0A1H9FLP1_9HYPH|nr:tRNA dimethylallyltransferase [Faunimonas pinastri]